MQRRTKDFIVLGVKYKVSEDYADEEDQARRFRKGLWGGGFTLPWVWRGEKP